MVKDRLTPSCLATPDTVLSGQKQVPDLTRAAQGRQRRRGGRAACSWRGLRRQPVARPPRRDRAPAEVGEPAERPEDRVAARPGGVEVFEQRPQARAPLADDLTVSHYPARRPAKLVKARDHRGRRRGAATLGQSPQLSAPWSLARVYLTARPVPGFDSGAGAAVAFMLVPLMCSTSALESRRSPPLDMPTTSNTTVFRTSADARKTTAVASAAARPAEQPGRAPPAAPVRGGGRDGGAPIG